MGAMTQRLRVALGQNFSRQLGDLVPVTLDAAVANRFSLVDLFTLRPGINANRDVPAGDTYNTAQMQLGIDKNPHFEVLGTNATSALVTLADGGGLVMTTAGTSGDQIILAPHLNTSVTAWTTAKWNTEDKIIFETVIKTSSNITAVTIWAGFKLTNTSVTATDNDQVFFRYQDTVNSGKWQVVDSNNNTDKAQDYGLTVAVSTAYHLKLMVDVTTRIPGYQINNGPIKTGSALKADTDLIPYIGIQTGAASAKAMNTRGIACSKLYND